MSQKPKKPEEPPYLTSNVSESEHSAVKAALAHTSKRYQILCSVVVQLMEAKPDRHRWSQTAVGGIDILCPTSETDVIHGRCRMLGQGCVC